MADDVEAIKDRLTRIEAQLERLDKMLAAIHDALRIQEFTDHLIGSAAQNLVKAFRGTKKIP